MVWAVKLGEYNILYESIMLIKGPTVDNFIAKFIYDEKTIKKTSMKESSSLKILKKTSMEESSVR